MQVIMGIMPIITSVGLIALTILYVIYTRKLLSNSRRASEHSETTILGIEAENIHPQDDGSFFVDFSLRNIGLHPAVNIFCDGDLCVFNRQSEKCYVFPANVCSYLKSWIESGGQYNVSKKLVFSAHAVAAAFSATSSDYTGSPGYQWKKGAGRFNDGNNAALRILVWHKNGRNGAYLSTLWIPVTVSTGAVSFAGNPEDFIFDFYPVLADNLRKRMMLRKKNAAKQNGLSELR